MMRISVVSNLIDFHFHQTPPIPPHLQWTQLTYVVSNSLANVRVDFEVIEVMLVNLRFWSQDFLPQRKKNLQRLLMLWSNSLAVV